MSRITISSISLALVVLLSGCSSHKQEAEDLQPAAAIKQGYVVVHLGDNLVSNTGSLVHFIDKVTRQEPASVRIVKYTIEGDPIVESADYNGSDITYVRDSSRDKFGSGKKETRTCASVQQKAGKQATAYELTGCKGDSASIALASVSYRSLPQQYTKGNISATLELAHPADATSANLLTLRVKNTGSATIAIGSDYTIEVQEYGTWRPLSYQDNVAFTAELHHLLAGEQYEHEVGLDLLKEPLAPGHYRVVKPVESGERKFQLAVEFAPPA